MFAFGENWNSFSRLVTEDRIKSAEEGLLRLFPKGELSAKPFFDIGCGSGLSMVAALRLGASEAHGIDVDADSVSTSRRTLERFAGGKQFSIRHQSVFDLSPERDGRYPIVYSWGVLHHTGSMWHAIENAAHLVAEGGQLFIAIYNDQGRRSDSWRRIKRLYCSGQAGRLFVSSLFLPYFAAATAAEDLKHAQNPLRRYITEGTGPARGMSVVRDWVDWLGGYPFEVARPEQVFDFVHARGFELTKLKTTTSLGCNEFVFRHL